jgi:hypothetical protein
MVTAVNLSETACLMDEHQYSALELAVKWNVSEDLIYRTLKNEPGVVFHGAGPQRKMMRIPESVALRVYLRRSLK